MGQPAKTKQTTTQTRNVAAASPQELLLQQQNMQTAQAQAKALQDAMMAQQQYEQSPGYQQMLNLGQQGAQGYQGLMQNGMMPTSQQQQALQQYFQSIMAPHQQQLQQTAQQEAARRGMTISDSPIGGDYLRQLASYNAQMGGQQAGQGLQLGQANANMYQNAMNFGAQLGQNAQQNRLALAQAQPGSYNFGNQLAQNRIASAPVTNTQRGSTSQPFSQTFGQYAGGAADIGKLAFGSGTNRSTGMGGIFGAFGLGG